MMIRHTRAEEESGRRELLGSTVVGRHAGLTAALAVVIAANLLAALLSAASVASQGLPFAGSLALGLSTAGVGVALAAVAAVAAQLTTGGGPARGLAFAAMAVLFLLRAAGDSGVGPAAWLPPFGWARLTRAFTGDRWWVFALFAVATTALAALAYAVEARRDLAAGLLAQRGGPPAAAPGLRSALALVWRCQRGALLGWTVGCAVAGGLLGAAASGAASQLAGLFSGADALLTFAMLVFSQAVAAYAITAMLRARAEEGAGLAELLLVASPHRWRWAGAHFFFAFAGPVLLLATAGLTAGLAYGVSIGELAFEFGRVNETILALSPFTHVPRIMLGAPLTVAPPAALVALAVVLAAVGMAGVTRRDVR